MEFEFSGGALCLDFVNTVGHHDTRRNERLEGYSDLVAWGREAGLIGAGDARRLLRRATDEPRRAAGAFRTAIALRAAIYDILRAANRDRRPAKESMTRLNESIATAMPFLRLRTEGDGFGWTWDAPPERLDPMLWPVARSAADLLTSSAADRVCECNSDRCSWLVLDRSHARRRRWCDMKTCGNRAKARRHYARKKESPSTS